MVQSELELRLDELISRVCIDEACEERRKAQLAALAELLSHPELSCAHLRARAMEAMGRLARRKREESACQRGLSTMKARFDERHGSKL
ncbi:MAG: hypothetical protein IT374_21650 [Polyangiaceae bacterium]|nr:hypothetical protein [Polyangiaceae bacterium]